MSDVKEKKKKLIKVTCTDNVIEKYGYSNMNFALISKPAKGRVQYTKFMSCREAINKTIAVKVNADDNGYVDFEKLRLLIVRTVKKEYFNEFRDKLFSGKALLNRYEELLGWSPSTITTVNHPYQKTAWLLTGPKEWMEQPQLLAIATALLRIASIHGPLPTDTLQQAEDGLKKLYNDYMGSKEQMDTNSHFSYYPDIENYLGYLDEMKLLMTNVKKVFGERNIKKAWKINKTFDNNSNFGVRSGILSFLGDVPLAYNEDIEKARDRFNKIRNKNNNGDN